MNILNVKYNGQWYAIPAIKGNTGEAGADGYSPSASVTKVGTVATITITDKTGTTTAQISDGTGDTYTAGAGIDIIDDEISVDNSTSPIEAGDTVTSTNVAGAIAQIDTFIGREIDKSSVLETEESLASIINGQVTLNLTDLFAMDIDGRPSEKRPGALVVTAASDAIGIISTVTSTTATITTIFTGSGGGSGSSYTPSILDFKWSDHLLNNVSWLRADTFSWQDGTVYEAAYNELVSEYNNTSSVSDSDRILSPLIKLPTFTANTTDGITVADARNNTDAYTLINGVSSKQIGHWSDYWFSINYGYSTIIKSYTIKADSNTSPEYPSMWELQGSNDGTSWQNLDYKVDEVFSLGEEKTYELDGSGFSNFPWKMYRILFHNGVEPASTGELGKISFNVQKVLAYVSYKRTPKGYKIANKSQASAISEMYTNTGVAWYYVLDTTNQRFKLPRTKYGFTGLRDTVGKYIPESLPNIKGTGIAYEGTITPNGAFYTTSGGSCPSASYATRKTLNFNASLSSSAYQDNAPVQQRATQMYLYFYVGQFSQTATEQTAGLNAELFNSKADLDLSNAVSNASTVAKETVVGWGMPDYSAGISIGSSLPYTAPSAGVVLMISGYQTGAGQLEVNGIQAGYEIGASQVQGTSYAFPSKGDIITVSGAAAAITFFPMKGV